MKKTPAPIERFLALSDAEKDAQVAKYEQEIPLSSSRPLRAAERKQWARVKRKMGRPKLGRGCKTVAVSMEVGLLKEMNACAKAHKLKRSQAIAQGIQLLMRAG